MILIRKLFGRSDNKGFKNKSETALRDLIKIFTWELNRLMLIITG